MDHGFPQWTADAAPALVRRAFGHVRPASAWQGQDPRAGNSREDQLTPWSNDPVTDRAGEAPHLRDDDDAGTAWTPTAHPVRSFAGTCAPCHGRGYSRFDHAAYGIAASLVQFVPLDAPVKVSRLVLRNGPGRAWRGGHRASSATAAAAFQRRMPSEECPAENAQRRMQHDGVAGDHAIAA